MAALTCALLFLSVLALNFDGTASLAEPGNFTAGPGGLPPERLPQFVLLTVDDSLNMPTARLIQEVTDGRQTDSGCPITATMFAFTGRNLDCEAVLQLHAAGYEISSHTKDHKRVGGRGSDRLAVGQVAGFEACEQAPTEVAPCSWWVKAGTTWRARWPMGAGCWSSAAFRRRTWWASGRRTCSRTTSCGRCCTSRASCTTGKDVAWLTDEGGCDRSVCPLAQAPVAP